MKLNTIKETPLKNITIDGGNVMHALKATEKNFNGFGEAYFSCVNFAAIKAWKLHTKMTMNLIVPKGVIKFVFYEHETSQLLEKVIGDNNYSRLTVPPGLWFGFQGVSKKESLLLNIADIPHDPLEVQRKLTSEIDYNWEQL